MIVFAYKAYFQILLIIIAALGIILATMIYFLLKEKRKSFRENYRDYKETIMSIIIDEDEKRVERHYSYSSNKSHDYMSIDEFYLKFDSKNLAKLKNWLEISKKQTYYHNIELVMYDDKNSRRVYMIEVDKIDHIKNRIYLTFSDVTESLALQKRIDRANNVDNLDAFYSLVLEKLHNTDNSSYLIAIKYREFKDITHALKGEFIQLIDSTIYTEVRKEKFENDLLCIYGPGIILLSAFNVTNEKRLKSHIKKILVNASKTYIISKNQFSVTLLAGIRKIEANEDNISARVNEAVAACDSLFEHFIKTERIRFYDTTLSKKDDEKDMRHKTTLNIVNKEKFTTIFKPFIDVNSNEIKGYIIDLKLPTLIEMDIPTFYKSCREIGLRKILFTKMYNNIINSNHFNDVIYFPVDYSNLARAIDALQSSIAFENLNIVFCISFNNLSNDINNDVLIAERAITRYIKEYDLKFGLNFNSLQSISLNDTFYEFAKCILLSGSLIKYCLDNYKNNLLLDVYVSLAKKYNIPLYASNINSFALYEHIYGEGVNYTSGDIYDLYANENAITDKNFLARIEEAKSKTTRK